MLLGPSRRHFVVHLRFVRVIVYFSEWLQRGQSAYQSKLWTGTYYRLWNDSGNQMLWEVNQMMSTEFPNALRIAEDNALDLALYEHARELVAGRRGDPVADSASPGLR